MNLLSVSLTTIFLVVMALFGYLIREGIILEKRRVKTIELRMLVELVLHEDGDVQAERHLRDCYHISTHYGIPIPQDLFKGSLRDFRRAAYSSFGRYVSLFRKNMNEFWTIECSPDEFCICKPVAQGLEDFQSIELYSRTQRRLRMLERQHNLFLARTRDLFGPGVFSGFLSITLLYF